MAAYLSPEQVQGKPVDQRSNTYSLAAVFYHLITGEPPFQGTPETVLELHVSQPAAGAQPAPARGDAEPRGRPGGPEGARQELAAAAT